MLNNTELKIQTSFLDEIVAKEPLAQVSVATRPAANASRFDQSESFERRLRRERRRNRSSSIRGSAWRVVLW
jgi:hypothetical protein